MELTQERLKEVLHYTPETGVFTWKVQKPFTAKRGSIAGHLSKNGYVTISIDSHIRLAHRLAWLYVYGEWPAFHIDHIDGNRSNNMIFNLRADPLRQNQQNRRCPSRNNTSGYLGVCWSKSVKKWEAKITENGKRKVIGWYESPIDAHEAYLKTKREIHPFCTI